MSLTLKHLDNSVEDKIRKTLASLGHQVDTEVFYPSGTGYDAAKGAIQQFVDVVGVSSPKDRKLAENARVTLFRTATPVGEVGYQKKYYFKPIYTGAPGSEVLDHYEKYQLAEQLFDVEYEIRFIVDSTYLDQVCTNAFAKAYNTRAFLYGLNDDFTKPQDDNGNDEGFHFMLQGGPVDLSNGDKIEKYYRYLAKNIDLQGLTLVDNNIKVIDEVSFILGDNDSNDYATIIININE